ncbi:DEAD/DEAH box helicase [Poseidonibacter antarcticus]|uniref:DEAD/DEAH box helicase n=1 Tax=Poseidonibacter antarcticus TaxID=2478538 RepID=UPI000EF50A40|nr:helicase-related protein [Poseidonibacter antarcticus]
MKKGIYKQTNQNIIIIEELDEYCEILLDGEYKTVLKNEIEFLSSNIKTSSLNELQENIFINCIRNPLSDILYSFNTNRLTPEPHQYKPLVKFLNSENNRVLIADEVGLGKTIEAGMIYKEIDKREELKISLIIVPSSLTYKWQEELNIRFDEYFTIYKTNQFINFIDEVENYSNSKLIHEKIIISYHTLRDERVMKKLNNSFFEVDFLIMDEAHTMRNNDTSTFDSAEIITSLSEHIIFLTATPVQNSLSDLFNILSLLDNDYFKDYDYFEKMLKPNSMIHKLISLLRNNTPLYDIKTFIRENENDKYPTFLKTIFNEILVSNNIENIQKIEFIDNLIKADHLSFIINRTKKKDVGLSTPRNASSIIVNITEEESAYYDAVIEFVKFLNPETPQGFITIMPERMASSSMIASLESFKEIKKSGKLFIKDIDDLEDYHEDIDIRKEAIKYLDNIIIKGELIGQDDSKFIKFEEILKDLKSQKIKQMIVFSFFKKTLDYLEIKLQKLGYSVGKIHGDFSIEDRFAKIKEFKNGSFDILLSSEVGSEGLDMQFCNVVINYDLPWNPMRVEQRIGRIDRIGQKFDKLHIFNLCIIGSIEDRILNKLYGKLNIFESSIGELEPILGELEKEFNISELMKLSQEEIDEKLNLKELALERKKLEISKHSKEFDKMLNEDLNYKEQENSLLKPLKVNILQEQSKQIVSKYLQNNEINFLKLKDGSIKLSSENLKQFFNILKQNMSDKRKEPLKYKEERILLQKIHRYKELKITFTSNNNDNLQTLYLYLNNPIMSIITKDKNHKTVYSFTHSSKYHSGFAIIYRVDFKQLKTKSYIKTIILDNSFSYIEELDYFDFINDCSKTDNKTDINFEDIKSKSTKYIIKNIEKQKEIEKEAQNRLIDIKISSIQNYFNKQIKKVKRLEQKVLQEDVKRMRIGEIENLKIQRDKKVQDLESKKEITSSFEILGIVGMINE